VAALDSIRLPSDHQLLELVTAADVQGADLEPWADYYHPSEDSYGRQIVLHGGHYEIMVMTWLPGDISAIHDHGGAEWGLVKCFGHALHDCFRLTGMVLEEAGSRPYHYGDMAFIDASLIHQMGNLCSGPFLSLHVYGCRRTRPLITGQARVFDLDLGEIQFTDGGVFHALPDSRISRRKHGLRAAPDLVARQRALKLARLQAMAPLSR
jgi:predicted metal-dependent enzyme (double-stranded beta helix superfamily)